MKTAEPGLALAMVMTQKQRAAVLMGPPGSGKTTLSRGLARFLPVLVIETGNLLRAEAKLGGRLGEMISAYQAAGDLVPSDILKEVIFAALDRNKRDMVLFDGFPRNMEQTKLLTELLDTGRFELGVIFIFEITFETVSKRLGGRRVCPKCHALYHLETSPPTLEGRCDRCGEALVQRPDDRPAVVQRRFDNYRRETVPVIEYFERQYPQLCSRLSMEGHPDTILQEVAATLMLDRE